MWSAHGRNYAPAHPFGTALMLLPAYIAFGHFIGNGVYAILFYTLATSVILYCIGRTLRGRLTGCFAALFFLGHHNVGIYSRVLMSEIPSCFLYALVFALLFVLRRQDRFRLGYLLVGGLIGLALCVRFDSVLLVCAVFLLEIRKDLKATMIRCSLLALGILPWILSLGIYNHSHYGNYRWSGRNYWNESYPSFSLKYLTARGQWMPNRFTAEQADRLDGNLIYWPKALVDQADGTLPFGPTDWSHPKRVYQILILVRAVVGMAGLWFCFAYRKSNLSIRYLLLWFFANLLLTFFFFLTFHGQEVRYFLRLVPFFSLLDAIGLTWLLDRLWHLTAPAQTEEKSCLVIFGVSLVAAVAYCSASSLVYHGDPIWPCYDEMTTANGVMESNAVVVTNFDPFRTDYFLIRGTQRTQIPLVKTMEIFPGFGLPSYDPSPLIATNAPNELWDLLNSGRPGYVLLDYFYGAKFTASDIAVLSKNMELQSLAFINGQDGKSISPYLIRLKLSSLRIQ